MKTEISDRLKALRRVMEREGIDAYLIPTDDFHGSEYVADHFQCRRFISGFTGSAGTVLVMADQAGLWTDGRYFEQAEREIRDTGITLFRAGEPEVPTIHEYIRKNLKNGETLGMDGRTVSANEMERFEKELLPQGVRIRNDLDLVGEIWEDRPEIAFPPVFDLDVKWCGKSREEKLSEVKHVMEEAGAKGFLLSSLEDIAWLLNLRTNDKMQSMVVLSYLYMNETDTILFTNEAALPMECLRAAGVIVRPYDEVYAFLGQLSDSPIMLSKDFVNSRLLTQLKGQTEILDHENPTYLARAIKNAVEMENMRTAHMKDGVAVTKFICWLKQNAGKEGVTELSAADKLFSLRKEQESFLCNSFNPIIAYREHGSIIHYSATDESNVLIQAEGMVLADTGGQYLEGTTDITRTFVVGPVTDEEKFYFTTVLKGHLNLLDAKFREGCTGLNLDYLAREPLWRLGKDYNHGTGHGVGYLLNVHEGPNGFRWRVVPERKDNGVLQEGMITSDEPGYYEEGRFGIRHESLLLCKKAEKTEAGQFMEFEPLTLVPFDRDGLDINLLTEHEKEVLNAYHRKVREAILPFLSEEEQAWLVEATREIHQNIVGA